MEAEVELRSLKPSLPEGLVCTGSWDWFEQVITAMWALLEMGV